MKAKSAAGTGVFLLSAALLAPKAVRVVPGATETAYAAAVAPQADAAAAKEKKKALQGPWQASCNYWSLGQEQGSKPGETLQCGPEQWGDISGATDKPADRPITSLIATIPDPVHSSMAMEFDRMVDVITQAAADNGYAISYYWLPWRRSTEKKKPETKDAAASEEEHDEQQEHQPGLLILKPAKPGCDLSGELAGRDPDCDVHTVYLFLVGQAPGFGTNRAQLRNALRYEQLLWSRKVANLSLRHSPDQADVIGPNNSGAAASLRAELEHTQFDPAIKTISVAGVTSTAVVADALNAPTSEGKPAIHFTSFSEDARYEMNCLSDLFSGSKEGTHLAWLYETGTTFGAANNSSTISSDLHVRAKARHSPAVRALAASRSPCHGAHADQDASVSIPFPREISILRNAQKEAAAPTDAAAAAVADADPYLHLSLKNGDAEDSIPHFSREIFPYVEESEWMATVRELQERRTSAVAISASNVLDALFLAKSVYRDLPDVQPVFFASNDLLYVRAGDAEPYVGAISLTAYPLTALARENTPGHLNNFASFWTEAFYNAVSYTLWSPAKPSTDPKFDAPTLAGYSAPANGRMLPPPLWITTVGRDGYYPLSIFSPCSSGQKYILPAIETGANGGTPSLCNTSDVAAEENVRSELKERKAYPAVSWFVLTLVVLALCIGHTLVIGSADFWSPFSHDLAIAHGDEPRRRAVYLHIFTAMLFTMSAVCSIPALCFAGTGPAGTSLALATLFCGLGAVVMTLRRTLPHIGRPPLADLKPRGHCGQNGGSQHLGSQPPYVEPWTQQSWMHLRWRTLRMMLWKQQENLSKLRFFFAETKLYPFFNWVALLSAVLITAAWFLLCTDRSPFAREHTLLGTFFSYRCLHPGSGVSPLLPVVLILASWCLWAFFQTCRLRFSENSRPMLPGPQGPPDIYTSLYVHDGMLSDCSTTNSSCLYDNVTCLLITHRILWRASTGTLHFFNALFLTGYFICFVGFVLYLPIRGLDHYLRPHLFHMTPYEALIAGLFYPLLVIALTGALRMVLIWSSLRSGLLQRLERSPMRYAFSRLTNISWMTMLRQAGVVEYWRDMTRSNESMGQILHCRPLLRYVRGGKERLSEAYATRQSLEQHIRDLYDLFRSNNETKDAATESFLVGPDLPSKENRGFLNLMCAIECDYARFAEALLSGVLMPYWIEQRAELVDAEGPSDEDSKPAVNAAPPPIQLAEEFLAMRYLSLIRAVLINLRQLMSFVSMSFVAALLAWNSYPFQPRRWVDWAFTGLLLCLGAAIVWVFAQMHRDPILSRITGTEANKLGADFFVRLLVFGAAPVLTWMASQFPAIGATVSRFLQQGLAVAK